jgi:hypothetical protein
MMLKPNPEGRWDAATCLKAKWFDLLKEETTTEISHQAMANLMNYDSQNLFKKVAMNSLMKMATEKEI